LHLNDYKGQYINQFMGQYTQLRFTAKLKKDATIDDIDLLKQIFVARTWALDSNGKPKRPQIAHKFFDCERWLMLLTSKNFDE
jgi:hypothetical protein